MKKLIFIFLLSASFWPLSVIGKNQNENITTRELTRIESMSKKNKLKIIYICGGVILVGSCFVLIPIMKEKR